MSATETKVSVAKLNNTNYQLWKFKLEMILSRDELWEIVHDDIPETIDSTWSKKNRQAMATVSLSVEDNQLIHIRKCNTAKGMWDALKKLHERANLNSKLYLLRKLYKLRLDRHQNMNSHINNMLEIVEQLRGIGEEMKDDHIAALILCSLPESYGALITALEARPEGELTLELVKGKLIDEYNRRRENNHELDNPTAPESALRIEHNFENKRNSRGCYYCGKQGHIIRDCHAMKAQRLGPKYRPPHRAKTAARDSRSQEETPDRKRREKREEEENYCFCTSEGHNPNEWYIDSGATSHMTSEEGFFTKLELYNKPDRVLLADGSTIEVKGIGSGNLESNSKGSALQTITVNNVLFVPKLEGSLLSVKRLTELGYEVNFRGSRCEISKGRQLLITAKLEKHLYKLDYSHKLLSVKTDIHCNCIHIWHRRLGHRDPMAIRRLEKEGMTSGLTISPCSQTQSCEECIKGKMTIKSFPKQSDSRANKPYEVLHSDICGPMKTATIAGRKYVATIIDDYSGYTEVFLLKTKDEMNEKLIEYFNKWNNHFQRKPLIFRTDGGGEYVNKILNTYLKQKGIRRQITTPYSPQQNGIAERKNRSLIEMTRCMLLDAGLDNTFWGEAINTATYLQNRLPHRLRNKTPYELWYNKKPRIDHLRTFGCKVFWHVPKEKLAKLDNRAECGIFMGYSEFSKAYRILQPETGKIIINRSVMFNESQHAATTVPNDTNNEDGENSERSDEVTISLPHQDQDIELPKDIMPTIPRISQRINKGIPAKKYACSTQFTPRTEPQTLSDIMELEPTERSRWLKAIEEEMESFKANNAWELVNPPEGKNIVGCRWTFKSKFDSKGTMTQYKARLVAKGYSQKAGEDFTETYAPVVKYTTMRILLVIAASKKMKTCHLDVKSAFLNGDLAEEIYMEQPEGQIHAGQEKLVCRLRRSIYGLKQSANTWNNKINEILLSKGYIRGLADQCLYIRNETGSTTYILLYVDDLLICSDDQNHVNKMKQSLEDLFQMKDLGEATYYLGIHIKHENNSFIINNSSRIKSLALRFGLEDANDAHTPMESDYLKIKNDGNCPLPSQDQYREAVGVLLYLSMVSRPDISAAAGFLGRKVSEPFQSDWTAVKRVIRYLKSTPDIGVVLGGQGDMTLSGYSDSDWAGDGEDRKSTSGYAFHLNNSLISWCSRKQTCVAMSSTEAEYVAAATACQELRWLRQLLSDFGYPQKTATILHEDNQGCIKLVLSDCFHARTKHIDVKYHVLKHLQEQGEIKLEYCPTNIMLADIFTKPLTRDRFQELRSKLRMRTSIC